VQSEGKVERVIIVDENDREIGEMEKIEAHQKGMLHRAFSVFLLNRRGELLVHRRAAHKYHSGGLWANSCDGHPRPGETTVGSAWRRVGEELGIDCRLSEVDRFLYRVDLDHSLQEHEYLHVLTGIWDDSVRPNLDEMSEVRWVTAKSLQTEMQQEEYAYCHWTRAAFARLLRMHKLSV
jgi:isopentenyl-diphosphate delta-isomerase